MLRHNTFVIVTLILLSVHSGTMGQSYAVSGGDHTTTAHYINSRGRVTVPATGYGCRYSWVMRHFSRANHVANLLVMTHNSIVVNSLMADSAMRGAS